MAYDDKMKRLLNRANERVKRMSPEEREALHQAQRENFARAMRPCEHGIADWEDCPDCRRAALQQEPKP